MISPPNSIEEAPAWKTAKVLGRRDAEHSVKERAAHGSRTLGAGWQGHRGTRWCQGNGRRNKERDYIEKGKCKNDLGPRPGILAPPFPSSMTMGVRPPSTACRRAPLELSISEGPSSFDRVLRCACIETVPTYMLSKNQL